MSKAPFVVAVTLRPARPDPDDALRVLTWRNDPVTLAASFHHAPKIWPGFVDEYLGYFDAPLAPQFGAVDALDVGFVRFRRCERPSELGDAGEDAGIIDISINIAPEARGRGLGGAIIRAASELALRSHPLVLAEIRPGNEASVRAFLGAGYERISDGAHDVDGELVPVARYLIGRRTGSALGR